MKLKTMIISALLTALAIVIPMVSFKLPLPQPLSVTFASHVPVMLSMFISPLTAVIVAAGSAIGFLLTLGPVIAARAAMHIIFAFVGAVMLRKNSSIYLVGFILMFIHGISEALIVLPFGFTLEKAGVSVGVVTMFHHAVDYIITIAVYTSLQKAGVFQKHALAKN